MEAGGERVARGARRSVTKMAGGPSFHVLTSRPENSGCPVLAFFARAGTMLLVPLEIVMHSGSYRSYLLGEKGSVRVNERWTQIPFRGARCKNNRIAAGIAVPTLAKSARMGHPMHGLFTRGQSLGHPPSVGSCGGEAGARRRIRPRSFGPRRKARALRMTA
jgi:hypothetical protein